MAIFFEGRDCTAEHKAAQAAASQPDNLDNNHHLLGRSQVVEAAANKTENVDSTVRVAPNPQALVDVYHEVSIKHQNDI